MSFANHPLGLPITYAAKLVRRHSDVGFILAQLDREYGPHNVTRAQVAEMRAKIDNDNQRARQRYLVEVELALKAEPVKTSAQIAADKRAKELAEREEAQRRAKRREIERKASQRARLNRHFEAVRALDGKVNPAFEPFTVPEIIACIAWHMGVEPSDIIGDRRHEKTVLARNVVAYVLVKHGNSSSQVGKWINRDHSSVLHAIKNFEKNATDKMRAIAARYTRGK